MSKPYQIVLDTNVLLAGLRSNRGASYKLLTVLNDSRWQLNISTALIFEYEEILKREKEELNLTIALSAQVSAWMTKDYIEEKAKRGSWDKFQQVLKKVPDIEPEDYDKLA